MKRQTKVGSLIESGANIAIGFVVQSLANYFVFPLFGFHPTLHDLVGIALIMTVISIVRSYAIRRVQERWRWRGVPEDFVAIAHELASERMRQIAEKGYTLDHDDGQRDGAIAFGAAAYLLAAADPCAAHAAKMTDVRAVPGSMTDMIRRLWVWDMDEFKPRDARRALVKAGAMAAAEIGRIDRAAHRASEQK
jgi:hypothetical protein